MQPDAERGDLGRCPTRRELRSSTAIDPRTISSNARTVHGPGVVAFHGPFSKLAGDPTIDAYMLIFLALGFWEYLRYGRLRAPRVLEQRLLHGVLGQILLGPRRWPPIDR